MPQGGQKPSRRNGQTRNVSKNQEPGSNAGDGDKKSIPAPEIAGKQAPERVAFPAQSLLLAVPLPAAIPAEALTACHNVWKAEFAWIFWWFPLADMTHDTMKRFITVPGRSGNKGLFRVFNEMLSGDAGKKLVLDSMREDEQVLAQTQMIAVDGWTVRVTRPYAESRNSRGTVSFHDCRDSVVLGQQSLMPGQTKSSVLGKSLSLFTIFAEPSSAPMRFAHRLPDLHSCACALFFFVTAYLTDTRKKGI